MTLQAEPLVSIVTPAYNAEKYLAECIESVLAQSYSNWEYIIVNNCSTDGTLALAEAYQARHARIRVVNNEEFLPLIANWNYALRQISPDAHYCKVVHADDWLFPECITRMVEVALQYPSVGMVSAYRLNEDRVDLDGLPYPSTFISGQEAGALVLGHRQLFLFGSPTSTLLRCDLIRNQDNFYDDQYLHADTDACFRIMQESVLGFVHQVLTYTRRHNESITSRVKRFETIRAEMVGCLMRYGPYFLDEQEFRARRRAELQGYYRMLSRYLLAQTDPEFWHYHAKHLATLGMPFAWRHMLRPLFFETAEMLLHFKHNAKRIVPSVGASAQNVRQIRQELQAAAQNN